MFYADLKNQLRSLRKEIFYTGNALVPHENVDDLQEEFNIHIEWIKDRIVDLEKHGNLALSQHYFSIYQKSQEEINELREILAKFA